LPRRGCGRVNWLALSVGGAKKPRLVADGYAYRRPDRCPINRTVTSARPGSRAA